MKCCPPDQCWPWQCCPGKGVSSFLPLPWIKTGVKAVGYAVGRGKGRGEEKLGSPFRSVGASVMLLCLPVPLSPLETSLDEGILPQPPWRRMAVVQRLTSVCTAQDCGQEWQRERTLRVGRPWFSLGRSLVAYPDGSTRATGPPGRNATGTALKQ